MPWGTHFCLFHQTRPDLLDTLISYFRTGLDNDEFCLWVVSQELTISEAWAALRKAVPDVDQQAGAGRVELISHDDWFLQGGDFDVLKVMDLLSAKRERANANGLSGMRLNGSTAWLQKRSGPDFQSFELALDEVIADRRVIVLCSFPLDDSKAGEMLAAADTHHFTVAVRDGVAKIVETFEAPPREHSLTPRALEVLTWVARGKSAWEIATSVLRSAPSTNTCSRRPRSSGQSTGRRL